MIVGRRGAAVTVVACGVLALTGCGGNAGIGPTTYVTVTVPRPAPAAPLSTSAAAPPRPSVTAKPITMSKLPGPCDSLLPLGSVIDALGHDVTGATAFVVGEPDHTIDRVSYINCRYGVSKKVPTPMIEIGVSLYRTAAKAEARIRPTIEDYAQHAAKASETTVAGLPATLLDGGAGAGYGPTIVLAAGQRTIAVSFRSGTDTSTRVQKDLVALAALAAQRTGLG